eukprot:TRINITY_DN3158_c0_g1_i12.p2 TRINITY_DN3158_c0_g1~~TRINITY_DN3158_c0_g1_i12.p2  ORF type:complete len:127 (-),score=9.20 TRINITY_DN3158_c0_g1_i12:289-669(-)
MCSLAYCLVQSLDQVLVTVRDLGDLELAQPVCYVICILIRHRLLKLLILHNQIHFQVTLCHALLILKRFKGFIDYLKSVFKLCLEFEQPFPYDFDRDRTPSSSASFSFLPSSSILPLYAGSSSSSA